MNSQLYEHLQTFDSGVTNEKSTVLENIEKTVFRTFLDSWNRYHYRIRQVFKSEFKMKMAWSLPFVILLGNYMGFFFSFNILFTFFLIVSQMKLDPEGDRQHASSKKMERKEAIIDDCRREVSHLLGLVGAPPMAWISDEHDNNEDTPKVTQDAAASVVNFVQAHSQFLLAIDETFHLLRVSSSIHLGLGPHSQCVERVERAAMAREYRERKRHRRENIEESMTASLEPQNGMDKSILAMASLRKNLAKSIINQSISLENVLVDCDELLPCDSTGYARPYRDPLTMPSVVDLAWIKSSRQHLAESLCVCAEYLCNITMLASLSQDRAGIRKKLSDSLSHALDAREYLLSTILSGDKMTPLSEPNNELLRSLISYKTQLDAISAALWSGQCYEKNSSIGDSEEDQLVRRYNWWSQIQQLAATCRAFEDDITNQYFPRRTSDLNDDDSENDPMIAIPHENSKESSQFVHGDDNCGEERKMTTKGQPKLTKTRVFAGQGSIEDRPKKHKSTARKRGGNGSNSVLPDRDAMSERLLVTELQRYIKKLLPPEEEMEESNPDPEAERKARAARKPVVPLFLGASGSLLSELKLSLAKAPEPPELQEEVCIENSNFE